MVVVVAPGPDQMAGMAQVSKQVLVEALVHQTAVGALHEAVLHRLAGRDVVPLDLTLLLPFQDRFRGEIGPIASRKEALFVSYGHARSRQIAQRVAITSHRSQQWFC